MTIQFTKQHLNRQHFINYLCHEAKDKGDIIDSKFINELRIYLDSDDGKQKLMEFYRNKQHYRG